MGYVMPVRPLPWLLGIFILISTAPASAAGMATLTPDQRDRADALIYRRSTLPKEPPPPPDLKELQRGTELLAQHKDLDELREDFQFLNERRGLLDGWMDLGDATHKVADQITRSHAHRRTPPPDMIEKGVDDLIWHFERRKREGPYYENRTREAFAHALALIGDRRAIPVLARALREEDLNVYAALEALPDPSYLPLLVKKVNRIPEEEMHRVFKLLALYGSPSVPVLIAFLEDRALHTRLWAARYLIRRAAPEALPRLEEGVKRGFFRWKGVYPETGAEHEEDHTSDILRGIQRIRCRTVDRIFTPPVLSPQDTERIMNLRQTAYYVSAGDEKMRERARQAADLLVEIGAPALGAMRIPPDAIPIFSEGNPRQRLPSIALDVDLLVRMGPPSVPALIDALVSEDSHPEIALEGLQQLTGQSFGPDYEEWRRWYLTRRNIR
jgi:hypothetical protein